MLSIHSLSGSVSLQPAVRRYYRLAQKSFHMYNTIHTSVHIKVICDVTACSSEDTHQRSEEPAASTFTVSLLQPYAVPHTFEVDLLNEKLRQRAGVQRDITEFTFS